MMTQKSMTLNDVCEFIVDCLHKTAPTQEQGYPSIRTPNVGKGRLILENVNRVSQEVYEEWTKRAVPRKGDLILAREAPAGNVAIIKEGQVVCLGQRTVHLRPDHQKVDSDFLCYFLLAPQQQAALLAGETGATAGHVNMRDIRRLKIGVLPDINKQKQIGGIISSYDDLIENNERRIALLEESARLLYREWFVHFRFPGHEHVQIVDGLPQGWASASLGDLLTLKRGYDLPEAQRVAGSIPIVSSSGISGYHNTKKTEKPGIVTGRYGTLGDVYLIDEDFWPLNTALYVSDKKGNPVTYLFHVLKHVLAGVQSEKAAVPGLNRNTLHVINVARPPGKLMAEFENAVSGNYEQISTLKAMNQKLTQARDLLLPRLMSGEISV